MVNVQQLIEMLNKVPQGLPVWVEGCDCTNPLDSVIVERDTVVIRNALSVANEAQLAKADRKYEEDKRKAFAEEAQRLEHFRLEGING